MDPTVRITQLEREKAGLEAELMEVQKERDRFMEQLSANKFRVVNLESSLEREKSMLGDSQREVERLKRSAEDVANASSEQTTRKFMGLTRGKENNIETTPTSSSRLTKAGSRKQPLANGGIFKGLEIVDESPLLPKTKKRSHSNLNPGGARNTKRFKIESTKLEEGEVLEDSPSATATASRSSDVDATPIPENPFPRLSGLAPKTPSKVKARVTSESTPSNTLSTSGAPPPTPPTHDGGTKNQVPLFLPSPTLSITTPVFRRTKGLLTPRRIPAEPESPTWPSVPRAPRAFDQEGLYTPVIPLRLRDSRETTTPQAAVVPGESLTARHVAERFAVLVNPPGPQTTAQPSTPKVFAKGIVPTAPCANRKAPATPAKSTSSLLISSHNHKNVSATAAKPLSIGCAAPQHAGFTKLGSHPSAAPIPIPTAPSSKAAKYTSSTPPPSREKSLATPVKVLLTGDAASQDTRSTKSGSHASVANPAVVIVQKLAETLESAVTPGASSKPPSSTNAGGVGHCDAQPQQRTVDPRPRPVPESVKQEPDSRDSVDVRTNFEAPALERKTQRSTSTFVPSSTVSAVRGSKLLKGLPSNDAAKLPAKPIGSRQRETPREAFEFAQRASFPIRPTESTSHPRPNTYRPLSRLRAFLSTPPAQITPPPDERDIPSKAIHGLCGGEYPVRWVTVTPSNIDGHMLVFLDKDTCPAFSSRVPGAPFVTLLGQKAVYERATVFLYRGEGLWGYVGEYELRTEVLDLWGFKEFEKRFWEEWVPRRMFEMQRHPSKIEIDEMIAAIAAGRKVVHAAFLRFKHYDPKLTRSLLVYNDNLQQVNRQGTVPGI
ncbi:hypothetical protein DXG01_013198 [Tephrocybe rancida]|nr:hypothetical protein DXG01_013198 [Tephrocybe rancida]